MPLTTSISNSRTLPNNSLCPALPKFHPSKCHFRYTWKWVFSIWNRVTPKVTSPKSPPKTPPTKKESSENTTESTARTPAPPNPTNANHKSSNEHIPISYSSKADNLLI